MPVSRYNGNQPVVLPPETTPVSGPANNQPGVNRPLNLNLNLNDSWEVGGSQGPTLSPAVREKADTAVNNFDSRLRSILNHDAMSLAEGQTPFRNGDTLTDTQRNDLQDATKDMLMDMPIGALSPNMTGELREFLDRQGVSADNLETKTLSDLGDVGGDLAKKWADDLKDSSPAAYYGLLGTAGAAVGAYGFLQGSEALKDLGIKPEFKTKLFGDHLKVKAEAMWESRFRNPNAIVGLDGNYTIGDFRLRGSANVDSRDIDASHGSLGVRWGDNRTHLDAQVNGSVNGGLDSVRLSGRYGADNYHLYGNATLNDDMSLREANLGGGVRFDHGSANLNLGINGDGDLATVNGNVRYDNGRYYVRGTAEADLINDNYSADLWGGYKPTDNFEIGVSGGYDSDAGARVGLGATWRF